MKLLLTLCGLVLAASSSSRSVSSAAEAPLTRTNSGCEGPAPLVVNLLDPDAVGAALALSAAGGMGAPVPTDCGKGSLYFLPYTATVEFANGCPSEEEMAIAIQMVESHLFSFANIECAECVLPGACAGEVETFDSNWKLYTICLPSGGDMAHAEYTGAFAAGCTPCL